MAEKLLAPRTVREPPFQIAPPPLEPLAPDAELAVKVQPLMSALRQPNRVTERRDWVVVHARMASNPIERTWTLQPFR